MSAPLEKNEPHSLKNLKPHNIPIQGVCEFIKFNFFADIEASQPPKVLTPHNLPKNIELQLYRIQQKHKWFSNHDIVRLLSLPKHRQVLTAPLKFKYVYDYVQIYKTNSYFRENCVKDTVLVVPADNHKINKFYDYLS